VLALAAPHVRGDPSAAFAAVRGNAFWHESLASWIVTRHADAVAVLRDSERFASDWRRVGEAMPAEALSIQTLDLPEHAVVRRLLLEGFRTVDYPAIEREIKGRVLERLRLLAGCDSFDLVTELAEPLALATVCGFLGVGQPDVAWFVPVANAIVDGMDAGVWSELAGPAMAARAEIAAYTERWLAEPPAAGLVGYVARAHRDSGVDRTVLLNTFRVLLHAGFTSASKLLGLAAATLLTSGVLAELHAADTGLGQAASEELVRFESPVQALARACVADTELSGVGVLAGQAVTVLIGAANRDPARFAEPDRLRLDRFPNPHLGFGRGLHSCLGGPLAALQARVLFTVLAQRYPGTCAVAGPVHRRNLTLRGLERFEVTLQA
jgi:cytochrome P450